MKVNGKMVVVERVRRGWSQEQLAKRIGRHQMAVSRMERGQSSHRTIKEVAELFNLPLEELIA